MSIPDMQEYSLVYSENTPAYALARATRRMDKAYSMFGKVWPVKAKVKTISRENKNNGLLYSSSGVSIGITKKIQGHSLFIGVSLSW